MRIEEHFRQTLTQAVANEPPVVDAWERFERRAGRSRRWRFAFSLAVGIAVIAAAALVVPRLGSSQVIPDDPGPSPTIDPYVGWQRFEHESQGYRVRYPVGWKTTIFEHKQEFLPEELTPTSGAGADSSFAVAVEVMDRDFVGVLPNGTRGLWDDGREYVRGEGVIEGNVRQVIYVVDWSASRCGVDPGECPAGDVQVLHIVINGEDSPQYFGRYGTDGELVARSIERVA